MSLHVNNDDIMAAIFNKVQLVDVKFNDGTDEPTYVPSETSRKSLIHRKHSENHSVELPEIVELPAENGAKEVTNLEDNINIQKESKESTEKMEKTQENKLENTLEITSSRQSSLDSHLDCQIQTSIGMSELESPSPDYNYQSQSHLIHFENGTIDTDHSSIATPSPSVDTHTENGMISSTLSNNPTEHDLFIEELKTKQSQKMLATQASNDSEPENLDHTSDQAIELNLGEKENTPDQESSDQDVEIQGDDDTEEEKEQIDQLQKGLIATFPEDSSNDQVEKQEDIAKKKPPHGLQPLKLNQAGVEEQLESPMSPKSYLNSGFTSPNEKYREIEVRTPLHDSLSKAYSSFEPDKQYLIRQEMGHTTSIQHLRHRFQQPQQLITENGQELYSPSSKHSANSKIQFRLPPTNTRKEDEDHPKQPIVKTPHPAAVKRLNSHPLQTFPEAEVVLEEQKSVSELLSKFGVCQRVKTRKVVAPAKLAETQPKVVMRKLNKVASKKTPISGNRHSEGMRKALEAKLGQSNGHFQPPAPTYYTFWGGPRPVAKSNRLSEPPLGSLAAIQKSLRSVPNSPISSSVPLVRSAEPQVEGVKHFFSQHSTKNVRDFYRVWGNRPSNQGHISTTSVNTSQRVQREKDN